jgi:long-chain fatty acid transport protein
VAVLVPSTTFSNQGSTAGLTAALPGGQVAYGGNTGGNAFGITPVPSLYAAAPLPNTGNRYWLGVGINSPFGLADKYNSNWFGRYDSIESALTTIEISPALAMRVNNRLSIGGGPRFQHADALLTAALPCPNAGFGCGAAFDPATDGASRLEGSSWATGFHLGALWKFDDKTNIGFNYRSAMTQNVLGSVTISGLSGALAGNNGVRGATADLEIPDTLGLSVAHDLNPQLKLLGSVNYFDWSDFKEIRVEFLNGDPDQVTPENFNDTFSVALGGEWKHSQHLTFRGGVQFDQTPTNDADRGTRIPDGDRFWVSAGFSYDVNKRWSVDGALTHIFIANGDMNLTKRIYEGTGADTTVQLRGSAESRVDIISLHAKMKF